MQGRSFVEARRLSWGEADPAGTIYAPRAIDIAIQAIESLWVEALGLTFHEFLARHRRATPWVHTSCDFAAPLRAGEPFALRIALEKIGTTSMTWRAEASRPDGAHLFTTRLVAVMIDTTNGESCPILPQIRDGLQPYLA